MRVNTRRIPWRWVPCGMIAFIVAGVQANQIRPAAPALPPIVAPSAPEMTVTRVYDVRALVTPTPDFALDTSPHALAFVVPANRQNEMSVDRNSIFSDNAATKSGDPPSRTERADSLMKLVEATVAPASWREAGGAAGSIHELDGLLVVTQTLETQKAVADLLRQLSEAQGPTLRATTDWVLLPRMDVSKLLNIPAANDKKGLPASREVDLSALDKLPPTARRFHAELLSQNGQTVHFVSGRERTVRVSSTTLVDNPLSSVDVIGNVGGGIALQINCLLDPDRQTATVTLFSTFNDPTKSGRAAEGRAAPTTQPASDRLGHVPGARVNYRSVDGIVQECRTTVRSSTWRAGDGRVDDADAGRKGCGVAGAGSGSDGAGGRIET